MYQENLLKLLNLVFSHYFIQRNLANGMTWIELNPSQDYFFLITDDLNRRTIRFVPALSCHRCLLNTGVEKNEQHLNIDWNFDHQMSLSKSKCWNSNISLHFLKCAVRLKANFFKKYFIKSKNLQIFPNSDTWVPLCLSHSPLSCDIKQLFINYHFW